MPRPARKAAVERMIRIDLKMVLPETLAHRKACQLRVSHFVERLQRPGVQINAGGEQFQQFFLCICARCGPCEQVSGGSAEIKAFG